MNKTVNHCYNCPFYHSEYDEYSLHDSFTYTCGLAQFLKHENYFIDDEENSLIEPPDWCPLITEETVTIKFKRISLSNVLDMTIVNQQIHNLDIELNNIDDVNSEEYTEKYRLMEELCNKLENLMNEE